MSGITQALFMGGGKKALEYVGGFGDVADNSSAPSISLTALSGGVASAAQAGDLVIAAVAFGDANNRTITCTTTGYTKVADLNIGDCQLGVFYKRLTSSETSVAFSFGGASPDSAMAVHVWRNSNATTPLDATTITVTGSINPPAITTVTNNAVVVVVGADVAASASVLTAPSGMTNLVTAYNQDTLDASLGVASALVVTAGVYDPATFGNSTGNDKCAVTMAIRPE